MSRHILAISKEVPLCPPVPSQRTDQEARPIHILLLGAHLIIRLHSLSLLPRSLCSLSFNFPHYSPRLASENWSRLLQNYPSLVYRSVRTLSDVSVEAVGCRCWQLCSLTPLQSSTHYWDSLSSVLSPDNVCGETVDQYGRILALFSLFETPDFGLEDDTSLVELLNSCLFIFT